MRTGVRTVFVLAILAMALAACGGGAEPGGQEVVDPEGSDDGSAVEPGVELVADVERADPEGADPDALAEGLWWFAEDLAGEVGEPDENVVFSPLSIGTAFGMARAGADGDTAAEIDAVFGFDDDEAVTHASFNALDQHLEAAAPGEIGDLPDEAGEIEGSDGGEIPPVLAITNGIFPDTELEVHSEYIETLTAEYDAGVTPVDFSDSATPGLINNWVAEHTAGRIEELVDEFDSATQLVLANAVYFNADWRTPFTDNAGSEGTFTTSDGSEVTAMMMQHLFAPVQYAEGDGWQAVELQYEGEELAMWVVVPTEETTVDDVMSAEVFEAVGAGLTEGVVDLRMPQWDFDYGRDLVEPLSELGMTAPFSAADFSGISDRDLFISNVAHEATITVDEWGTEATAATALGLNDSGPPEPDIEINADRPFAFAIVDTTHYTPIFVGQVADPTS